jgi:NAD(P)H dehydrogenase (quinone)
MAGSNVVIIFCSHNGSTEKLALAAAVGAVQARANIRLRRLPDVEAEQTIECERMNREYVAPRERDVEWADAIILATPARLGASSAEWKGYVESLAPLGAHGKLGNKLGMAIGPEACVEESLCDAVAQLGLIVVPAENAAADAVERARLCGRRVGEMALEMKTSSPPGR